jgi:hypothetical protein
VSPSGDTLAVGDRSGVVNLYRTADILGVRERERESGKGRGRGRESVVKPFASSAALRSAVTSISFAPDERTFVAASSQAVDALKVITIGGERERERERAKESGRGGGGVSGVGGCRTLPSWPTPNTPLSLVAHTDISRDGQLSIATDRSSFLCFSLSTE